MRTLLLFFTLSSFSLFAQQAVPELQKPLVTKVTATWCPPCGGWGWDLFEDLVSDNASNAVLIAGHYRSSDLETIAGNEIASNFGTTGQPAFFLGNERQSASFSTASAARMSMKTAIDAAVASSPVANATLWATSAQGRSYSFSTNTQFFQASTGEYSLSVYAVEDGVVNPQASRGNDAVHERVMRGTLNGQGTFGAPVVNGAAMMDATFASTFDFDFPANWSLDDVKLVTVLWKKNGASYDFVNANEIEASVWQQIVSDTDNLLAASDYRITGFGESGILTTTVDLSAEAQGVSVDVIDVNGRLLATRDLGNTPSGKTQVVWDEVNFATGVYITRLRIGSRSISETVLMR